jgi:RHS repeat-associated protein
MTSIPATLRPAGATTALLLSWDFDNKLASADIDANGTADVSFQYDALGRRVARTGAGGSFVFVQMDQQTIADYPVGGAASTPTYRYVYASYIDEPVVRKGAGAGGTLVYFHRNHQYSVTAITTSTGAIAERYAYTAYGQPTILNASGTPLSPQTSTLNSRYSYTGREWDATLGLHHFRARWMSPSAGRFLGRDPIGYLDGDNLYSSYLSLARTDPTGLEVCGTAIAKVMANKLYRKQGFTQWPGHQNWTTEIKTTYAIGEQRLQLCAPIVECCNCKDGKGLGDPTVNGNGYTGYINQPFWLWSVFRTEGEPKVTGGDCPCCITATQWSFWYVSDKAITLGGSLGNGSIEIDTPTVGSPFFGGTIKLEVTICGDGTVSTTKSFQPIASYTAYNRWWREYDYWINETIVWSMSIQ